MENRIMSRVELEEIFHTSRISSIKRSLDSLGFTYTTQGTGKKLTATITGFDEFKIFAKDTLGFGINSDFETLKIYLYHFFNDDVFSAMPSTAQSSFLSCKGLNVSRQTLGKWEQKLQASNLIGKGSADFRYFSCRSDRPAKEITKEQYSEAWKAYWNEFHIGLGKRDTKDLEESEKNSIYYSAYCAMEFLIGGKAFKGAKADMNAFEVEAINKLISLLVEPSKVETATTITEPVKTTGFTF